MRLRVKLKGAVQGVGFRPFVYRLAQDLSLRGWVINNSSGVEIEVEGKVQLLEEFLLRLQTEKPPLAHIYSQEIEYLENSCISRSLAKALPWVAQGTFLSHKESSV